MGLRQPAAEYVTREEFDALRAEFAVVVARLAALEAGRGPLDSYDAALVAALARVYGEQLFPSAPAFQRGGLDPDLREAFDNACIGSAVELGHLLSRMVGVDVNGLVVKRAKTSSKGNRWRIEVGRERGD